MKENDEIEAKIAALTARIESNHNDAEALYRRGLLYWKTGRHGEAMSDYAKAAALDPESPAVELLDMSREIMGFFNKDLYNP